MKFEFGDLHKFTVSVGLVVVSFALIVPWIFLRDDFDLLLTKEQLSGLTPIAQSTIIKRQSIVENIIIIIPWVSVISLFTGALAIGYGLRKWSKNQTYIDTHYQLDAELKKLSLRDATRDEIAESIEEEVHLESQMESTLDKSPSSVKKHIAYYGEIESSVSRRFEKIYGRSNNVQQYKSINGIEIDILLRGYTPFQKDYIVELKYIRKGFNYGWLEQSYLKNILTGNHYTFATNRKTNTLLLILTEDNVLTKKEKYSTMIEKLMTKHSKRSENNLVVIMSTSEFDEKTDNELRSKLLIV